MRRRARAFAAPYGALCAGGGGSCRGSKHAITMPPRKPISAAVAKSTTNNYNSYKERDAIMAYTFKKKPTARFEFNTTEGSDATTKLDGINATLTSADTICDGVASLMAIGNNQPFFLNGTRTVNENVDEDY